MDGTTNSVRDSGGMRAEKSIRGNVCGVTTRVTSQFTTATASWLAATIHRMPIRQSTQMFPVLLWASMCRGHTPVHRGHGEWAVRHHPQDADQAEHPNVSRTAVGFECQESGEGECDQD